jgi:lysosomal acid phosphatase
MHSKKIIFTLGLIINLGFSSLAHAEDKLIFAVDIIRHGDRTPTDDIPTAPYPWPEGLGQLTPLGMQQEYLLGTKMRKRYIEQNHLLPKQYLASTMYVRSTDFNRTLMSAESLLLGLYPLGSGPNLSSSNQPALPANYQPIPITSVPLAKEDLLLPEANKQQFKSILQKYVFSQPEWQQKTAILKNKLIE